MLAQENKLFELTPPAKRLIVTGKTSIKAPSVISEQRNFISCPNTKTDQYLLNNKTGATLPIGCGRWDCPVCGEKKLWRLKKAIYNSLKGWTHVRHMTLTLSSNYSDSKEEHYKLLQECWRRFITELRRTKSLRKDERAFQFIRVPEEHQSGYMHMHCIINSFLPVAVLWPIWQHIIHEASNDPFLSGSVVITLMPGAKDGAKYLTKYISKLVGSENFIIRKYSKSGEVVLFSKKKSTGEWTFCFGIRPLSEDEAYNDIINFFTSPDKDITSQRKLTEDDSDPPDFRPSFIKKYLETTDEEFWSQVESNEHISKGFLG